MTKTTEITIGASTRESTSTDRSPPIQVERHFQVEVGFREKGGQFVEAEIAPWCDATTVQLRLVR